MRRPRPFLNTILGVVVAAGCSSDPTGPTEPGMSQAWSLTNLTIASCTATPETASSAVIGPGGGVLAIGPHRLVVPEGALSKTVTITARTGGQSGNAIKFGPSGLRFNSRVRLTISVRNCNGWGFFRVPLVVFTDDALKILELEPSLLDNQNKTVTGWISHFSRYAVAY